MADTVTLEAQDQDTDGAFDFLEQQLTGDAAPAPVPAAPAPAPQVAQPVQSTPAQAVQTPDPTSQEPAPQPAPDKKPDLPARFYTKNLPDQTKALLAVVMANPDLPPAEQLKLAQQQLGLVDDAGQPTPAAQELPPTLSAIDAELADVRSRLEAAANDEGIGTVYNTEVHQLTVRQAELVAEKKLLEREARLSQQVEAEQLDAQLDAATQKAMELYPVLADDSHPFTQAAVARIEEINALEAAALADPSIRNNPDVALALSMRDHPNFSILVARQVAAEMGILPGQAQPTGNPDPQQGRPNPAELHPQAQPGPVVFGGVQPAHRVEIREVSPEQNLAAKFERAAQADGLDEIGNVLDEMLTGGAVAQGVSFL